MQPQQPASPNPQYDFILSSNQKPKKGLPSLGLPRPVMLGLVIVIGLVVIALVFSLLFGSKGQKTTSTVSLAAQAQEIVRVSGLATQDTNDAGTHALAATVSAVLTSQETQLKNYWTASGHKIKPADLTVDNNTTTDTELKAAVQNNDLPSVYGSYLKSSLKAYSSALSSSYRSATDPKLKNILNGDYNSVQTLLDSSSL